MNIAQHKWFAFLLVFLVCACANLGVSTPDTLNEKIAVAISAVTAVRSTATALVQAKKITADDAQNVQDGADNARKGIEVARTLGRINMAAADSKLSAVTASIRALNDYLAARK